MEKIKREYVYFFSVFFFLFFFVEFVLVNDWDREFIVLLVIGNIKDDNKGLGVVLDDDII